MNFWQMAYNAGWCSKATLQQAVSEGLLTQAQYNTIIGISSTTTTTNPPIIINDPDDPSTPVKPVDKEPTEAPAPVSNAPQKPIEKPVENAPAKEVNRPVAKPKITNKPVLG
ncbi:MAG: XkdX family protein [Sarcina sp.]